MHNQPLKIIQISDIHLHSDVRGELLRVNTHDSYQAVLDLVRAKHAKDTDLIILSGDLTQDGSLEAYARVADLIEPFNIPVYCVPGNHDNPKMMKQVYPRGNVSNNKHIVLKNWQIILLDSHKPDAVEGYLDASELEYMQHCLQKHPDQHAIILFHHQPVPVGSRWLDKLWVTNADEFWAAIAKYPQIKTVLFGHVHQEFQQAVNGMTIYATPSTCIQFKPHQDRFGLDHLPPGYRWIHLFEDGHIETGVERIAEYIGVFDKDAKGY